MLVVELRIVVKLLLGRASVLLLRTLVNRVVRAHCAVALSRCERVVILLVLEGLVIRGSGLSRASPIRGGGRAHWVVPLELDLLGLLSFFLVQLQGFSIALVGEKGEQCRQRDLNEERWEYLQNDRTELGACDRRRHHNRDEAVVDEDHIFLLRVHRPEIVEETHGRADKDTQAGDGHCRLGCEVEERDDE